MSVAASGQHGEHSIVQSKNRHVKSASTKIKNHDGLGLLSFCVQSICHGSSSWLVDYSKHFESCHLASNLGAVSLRVVEVCRNSNYRAFYLLLGILLSNIFHLA